MTQMNHGLMAAIDKRLASHMRVLPTIWIPVRSVVWACFTSRTDCSCVMSRACLNNVSGWNGLTSTALYLRQEKARTRGEFGNDTVERSFIV